MFTFADLMRQAQGGQAIDNLAKAYGLSRAEFDRLMGTLLPVFALGMKRSAAEMASPAAFAEMLDPEKFRAAFEDTRAAVSPAATEAARLALEKMFGSGDAAGVIANQAAALTGIGADVVSKVMPAVAATLFGGLAKEWEGTPMAAFLKPGAAGDAAAAFGAFGNPVKDAVSAFLKGYAEGKPGSTPQGAAAPQWPAGMEGFGRMFEAGMEMNEAGRKAFEQWFGAPKP